MIERRRFLTLSAAAALSGLGGVRAQASETPVDITWTDLIPGGAALEEEADRLFRVMQHGEMWAFDAPVALTPRYNGKIVRLPGYMVPLDFEPDGVRHFLLVPFIGACVHVPPPPANQIVLVLSERPYPARDYFDAVTVTGVMDQLGEDLDLAEVGYIIEADDVTAYEF